MNRSSVGVGIALALLAAGLILLALAEPVPGLAASAPLKPSGPAAQVIVGSTTGPTSTIFLPLVTRVGPRLPNVWQGEYYANMELSGDPQYTTQEARVDYDWGDDGAPPGLPDNHFSIRWTGYWDFEVGEYTFFVYADDGVRLWLDETLLVDEWTPGIRSLHATVAIDTAGLHHLRLDFFENIGAAAIQLRWRRTDLYPQWRGDYYNQPWVEEGRQYRRTDSSIQFDWGEDCPPDLPCDGFSIAWKATPLFEPGTQRIFLYADEGYQLFIDGNKVGEGGWYDGQGGGSKDVSYDLEASGIEHHQITYHFHDRGTLAEARLWIVYLERPTWLIEFYKNTSLSGLPEFTDPDGQKIFFDWDLGKPWDRDSLPSNHFSIRWSGQRYFHAGCYRFGLFADDGVRLWVDGELLVDEWHAGRSEYHSPLTYLSPGYHNVVVEYFEETGQAEIRLWWE